MRELLLLAGWIAGCALPAAAGDYPGEAASAKAVQAASGIKAGLCLHLGCGRAESPGLTAALAEGSAMLVHGLALDDVALARAHTAIEARGVAGRAMAEKCSEKALPYLNNLACLVVVEDMGALGTQGITRDEILRVLAPGGALCALEGGKWKATLKPRTGVMDDWTHAHHGPDGNLVSADKTLSFPIGLRWIDGLPSIRGGGWASCRAAVLAGGRCFTVNVEDLANINLDRDKGPAYLQARDAFSGFPLWKLNCEVTYPKGELDWRNTWPLVATERLLYAPIKNRLSIIDAATGKIENVCPTKYQPRRLLLLEGCLVSACWEHQETGNPHEQERDDGVHTSWWPSGAGSIEAFDSETGKSRWTLPLSAMTIVASDGVVYALTHKGKPPTEREVVAINLATGKEKWRVPHTAFGGEHADTHLNFAGPGCVVVTKIIAKGKLAFFVLSAADGKVLYSIPNSFPWFNVDGVLWCKDGRYDLKTGQKAPGAGVFPAYYPEGFKGGFLGGGCTPSVVVGSRYITGPRWGFYEELSDSPGKPPAHNWSYQGARGACVIGMVPANGMFYTAQNNCGCYGAQVGGFLAVGPCGEIPSPEEFEKPRPVEKGPAFGAVEPIASPDDWPTYRHDAERGGGTSADVPNPISLLWKVACVNPGEGSFAEAWNSRIGAPQPLTAPIVAAGMVILAGLNSGQVMSLSPATGATVWKKALGSRIDSPPTCHQGMLLVGCHDGWVYALRVKDGALAYRVRIAPRERRMVAHGLVESVWPATGAVLVHDGLAYATAGRSTATDGGIALIAFKPETGETVWAKNLGENLVALIDMLSIRSGALDWHGMRMDPKTGKRLSPPVQTRFPEKLSGGAMLDGSWTALFMRRSGYGFALGRVCDSIMAWNSKLVITSEYAVLRTKAEALNQDKLKPGEWAWKLNLEPQHAWASVNAIALAGNTAFFAGRGWSGKEFGGFLWMKSTADGVTQQASLKLDALPSFDGLAVAGGRVYLCLQDGSLMCWGK